MRLRTLQQWMDEPAAIREMIESLSGPLHVTLEETTHESVVETPKTGW